ncbi:MAG: cell division protein SepF [Bacillota bacterium]|nr:cell division protein SepF [Bacillota bacterium]
MNKLKVLVGIEEIEDDEEELEAAAPAPAPERKAPETRSSYGNGAYPESRTAPLPAGNKPPAVGKETKPFKMVVIEPVGFDDCPKLVDSLKAKKPIIINLEKVESDTARKIFDFLSGATYALSGNVQKVSNNIFVFAPESVDVTAISEKGISYTDSNLKSPWR